MDAKGLKRYGRDIALMVAALLDASQEAGMSDETARRAASLLAGFDSRSDEIEASMAAGFVGQTARADVLAATLDVVAAKLGARTDVLEANVNARFNVLEAKLGARIDSVKSGLDFQKILFGVLLTLNIAVFLELFWHQLLLH